MSERDSTAQIKFEPFPKVSRFTDWTGKKKCRLTVLGYAGKSKWWCRCDCGTVKKIQLSSGNANSCGCIRNEVKRIGQYRHGEFKSSEYSTWCGMRARCEQPKSRMYRRYGGRGIKVCERWKDFVNFLKDMGRRPTDEHSLDRIDNDGDYCPENCRWATPNEQAQNTSRNRVVEMDGERLCVAEWCRRFGTGHNKINVRLKAGWTFEEAVKIPAASAKHPFKFELNLVAMLLRNRRNGTVTTIEHIRNSRGLRVADVVKKLSRCLVVRIEHRGRSTRYAAVVLSEFATPNAIRELYSEK